MFNVKTIGLTGGIASGKSAISAIFEKNYCEVVDADIIAREVVKPHTKGLDQLVDAFGKDILTTELTLDRSKLRKIVFNNKQKLEQINAILHPLIQQEIIKQIKNVNSNYCIVVIPLLCESNRYDWLDRILVVDVSVEIQKQRLLKRDAINDELAEKMIRSQCSREKRLELADDVIKNEASLTQLNVRIELLHRLYNSL